MPDTQPDATSEVDPVKTAEEAALAALATEENRLNNLAGLPTEETPETPEGGEKLILGKFKTQADLEKAYQELEAKTTKDNQQSPEVDPKTEPEVEEAKEVAEGLGLDFDKLSEEFTANNGLTEETIKSIVDKGIPRDVIDNYLDGLAAKGRELAAQLQKEAGGEEAFKSAMEWAAENMEEADKVAFNKAMESGDMAQYKLAVRGLMATYNNATGSGDFRPINPGGSQKGNGGDAEGSLVTAKSLNEAMSDPRYFPGPAHDPRYVAAVEAAVVSGRLK